VRPNLLEPAKVALLMFVAAILQVTVFSQIDILGGYPDVVLLTLVAIALLRGSIYGAGAGFRTVLLEALPPKVALNLLLTLPVYALTRWFLGLARPVETATEVRLLG
jgi:thiamine transporter ThiT